MIDDPNELLPSQPVHWKNARKYFFKYTNSATALRIIESKRLRYSNSNLLNDPFDVGFDLSLPGITPDIRSRVLESLWKAHFQQAPVSLKNPLGSLIHFSRRHLNRMTREEFFSKFGNAVDDSLSRMSRLQYIHESISKLMQSVKVLSLTEKPDHNLMWSHYAAAHTGVVLRFRSIPEMDSVFGLARPVHYTETMPSLLDIEELVLFMSGQLSLSREGMFEKLVYTKSSDWSYESEWRISLLLNAAIREDYYDLPFGWNELDAVIFGLRTPTKAITDLIKVSRNCNPLVRFYQIEKTPNLFELKVAAFNRG